MMIAGKSALVRSTTAAITTPKSNTTTGSVALRSHDATGPKARAALERAGSVERDLVYVTREEAHAAASACRKARPRAFIRFLWLSGARVSEALAVTPADIDTRTNVVHLTTLKRRNHRRAVPLPEGDIAALLYLATLQGVKPGERLWPWARPWAFRVVQRALIKAGVESGRARPHAFRHGHAIHSLRNGMSLDLVAKNLGHASVVTTSHYLRATAADVRAASDRIDW